MKQVKVTFTGEQALVLLTMIRNDTAIMEAETVNKPRDLIQQNNRMEARLAEAIKKAQGWEKV